MSNAPSIPTAEPRWKDLYSIGGIANFLLVDLVALFALGIIIPVFVIQAIFGFGVTIVGTLWFILLGRGFF